METVEKNCLQGHIFQGEKGKSEHCPTCLGKWIELGLTLD